MKKIFIKRRINTNSSLRLGVLIKKVGICALAFLILTSQISDICTEKVFAKDKTVIIAVDGSVIQFPDAKPFIDNNNRTLIPARFIAQALNASVDWDGSTKTATVTKSSTIVKIVIGNTNLLVNDQQVKMDTVAIEKEGRIFIPVRFIAEALGAKVSFNSKIQGVDILSSGSIGISANASTPSLGADDPQTRLSVSEDYSMVIRDDNTLWGWGFDNGVHLGLRFSNIQSVYKPAKIMDNAKSVFAGFGTAFVIKTDGSLWAWGDNMPSAGEERLTYSLVPIKLMDNVVSAASCDWDVFAVKADGRLWEWGDNNKTVLKAGYEFKDKDGLNFQRPIVSPSKLMDGVKKVAAYGTRQYLILKKDGTLLYSDGQSVLASDVRDVFTTEEDTYYIKSDNSLFGVGKSTDNYLREIGSEDSDGKIMTDVESMAVSSALPPIALKKDGNVYVWGDSGASSLVAAITGKAKFGAMDLNDMHSYKPQLIMSEVRAISAGPFQYLFQKKDGTVWTWGGSSEVCGVGDGSASSRLENAKMTKLEFNESETPLFSSNNQKSKLLTDWVAEYTTSGKIPQYDAGANVNWAGYWESMPLNIDLIEISGSNAYGYVTIPDKHLEMIGTIDGNTLRGNIEGGIFEFMMKPDGKSCAGLVFLDSAPEPGFWNCNKSD